MPGIDFSPLSSQLIDYESTLVISPVRRDRLKIRPEGTNMVFHLVSGTLGLVRFPLYCRILHYRGFFLFRTGKSFSDIPKLPIARSRVRKSHALE